MTGPVQLTAETDPGPELDLPRLRRLARWVLLQEGCRSGDVDILLTDDERIQALNLQYREQDRPTDVLAFGLQEGDASVDFVLPRGERPALGEVVISLPRAREQAAAYGQSCPEEVELLLVHGLLHLLGYDDALDEQRRHMQARQEQLLRAFERRTSLSLSFARAFAGLSDLWWTQRNARLHLTLALAAVLLGLILGLSLPEWALLSLAIAVVLVAEALNTALESLVDLISPQRRPLARRVKDVAAAAVLLAALGSIVVGMLLFLPRLWELFR